MNVHPVVADKLETIARLVDRGILIETKKHTYLKTEGS